MTFNHGVLGSSPSALTKQNQRLSRSPELPEKPPCLHCVCKSTAGIGVEDRRAIVAGHDLEPCPFKRQPALPCYLQAQPLHAREFVDVVLMLPQGHRSASGGVPLVKAADAGRTSHSGFTVGHALR